MASTTWLDAPLDDSECRYTQSFTVAEADSAAASRFFELHGFIVFRDVIEPELCRAAHAAQSSGPHCCPKHCCCRPRTE